MKARKMNALIGINVGIFLAILLIAGNLFAVSHSESFDVNDLEFSIEERGYDKVKLADLLVTTTRGEPELPVKFVNLIIPSGTEVDDIDITVNQQTLDGTYFVYPAQPPHLTDGSDPPPFVEPNSEIYDSSNPYPDKLVEVIADGFTMGYHIVTLCFYTVEYIPEEQKINLYTTIDFNIEYESNPQPVQLPLRQSVRRQKLIENFIKSSVENPDDFESVTGGAQEIIPEKKL